MKKFFPFIISFFIMSLNLQSISFAEQSKDKSPIVTADGAILMDATTGSILYSKNIDKPFAPASTTKLMTALLTLENCSLNEKVTIGKNPPLVEGSKIYLYEGEILTVKQLLYGLILVSGNDCAEALAEYIGGSIENFANMMNDRAKELGCENTNFVNPSGLYDDAHKSSAKDFALIMKELITHPEFTTIATTQSYNIPKTNKCNEQKPLWNENKLIQKGSSYNYSGCIGGKTGYTVKAWHSYVTAASRNNQKLIVVLLHDTKKTFFNDAISLLNYGFNNFSLEKLYTKGDIVDSLKFDENYSIPVLVKDDFYYVKPKNSTEIPKLDINKDSTLSSKCFSKEDIIAAGTVSYKNKTLAEIDLISGRNYTPKKTVMEITSNQIKNNLMYIKNFILTITTLLLLYLIILFKNRYKKSMKTKKD